VALVFTPWLCRKLLGKGHVAGSEQAGTP